MYALFITESFRLFLLPEIEIAASSKEFYVTLGDKLYIPCEGIGPFRSAVTWYHGQQLIDEFLPGCTNETRNYCLRRYKDEYKQQRVRGLFSKVRLCTVEYANLHNRLEIVMANWTDSGSVYRCVATSYQLNSTDRVHSPQEAHPIIHVG